VTNRIAILLAAATALAAGESEWRWTNPAKRDYRNEVLRVQLPVPEGEFHLVVDGEPHPHHVIDGAIWTAVDVAAGAELVVRTAAGTADVGEPQVIVGADKEGMVLANGRLGIKLADSHRDRPRCPLIAVSVGDESWVGAAPADGGWRTDATFEGCRTEVLADGAAFGRIRQTYSWSDGGEAVIDVTLPPDSPHAIVRESHAMDEGDSWEFDLAGNWQPRDVRLKIHGNGPNGRAGVRGKGDWTLETGQTRWGDVLLQLMPRWTQHYDDGWFFGLGDGSTSFGVAVGRPGEWRWPHDNEPLITVKESGDYAGLRMPTWKGRRYWLLLADPPPGKELGGLAVARFAKPLDKVVHEFITTWPDRGGHMQVENPYGDHINPTGFRRNLGKQAIRGMGGKPDKAGIGLLTHVQSLLHPDTYGSYWHQMSPENPNFFTDYIKVPVGKAASLKQHPRFAAIRTMVEQKLREDLYHSVTLPGGAGQECPGYLFHALRQWSRMAGPCEEHYGFDLTAWPRYRAAASFLVHVSQPIGRGKRRMHPGGDTHPPGADIGKLREEFGIDEEVAGFESEELPGFGCVLREDPGTDDETYIAFKAGPNRGHYHGDQLSLHVCAGARPLAVDHMCSYGPRAGQEHMHNRLSFAVDGMVWANMDGYERLIGFNATGAADVAVAEVASDRLRRMNRLPPEDWDQRVDVHRFETPLRYRRTLVFLRKLDALVIRDQWNGPEVTATFNLHVLGEKADREGGTVAFDRCTLKILGADDAAFDRLDWEYSKGKGWGEATRGVRFSRGGATGEFVSVLLLGDDHEVAASPGGVTVGGTTLRFSAGMGPEVDVAIAAGAGDEAALTSLLPGGIDPDRSQGEVGLFVPDAGYPFGRIPGWLIEQRIARPDWHLSWDEMLRVE